MRLHLPLLACVLSLSLTASFHLCATAQTPVPAAKSAGAMDADASANAESIRRRAANAQQANASHPLSSTEVGWMRQAAGMSRSLVEAGKIRVKRAVDPAVQGLAQSLVVRQEALMQELLAIANAQHLRMADAAPSAPLPRLAKTAGFDTVFVREVGIAMQTRAIDIARSEATANGDAQLAAWRSKYLDALRDGLSTAQQIPLRNAPDKTPKSSSGDPSVRAVAAP